MIFSNSSLLQRHATDLSESYTSNTNFKSYKDVITADEDIRDVATPYDSEVKAGSIEQQTDMPSTRMNDDDASQSQENIAVLNELGHSHLPLSVWNESIKKLDSFITPVRRGGPSNSTTNDPGLVGGAFVDAPEHPLHATPVRDRTLSTADLVMHDSISSDIDSQGSFETSFMPHNSPPFVKAVIQGGNTDPLCSPRFKSVSKPDRTSRSTHKNVNMNINALTAAASGRRLRSRPSMIDSSPTPPPKAERRNFTSNKRKTISRTTKLQTSPRSTIHRRRNLTSKANSFPSAATKKSSIIKPQGRIVKWVEVEYMNIPSVTPLSELIKPEITRNKDAKKNKSNRNNVGKVNRKVVGKKTAANNAKDESDELTKSRKTYDSIDQLNDSPPTKKGRIGLVDNSKSTKSNKGSRIVKSKMTKRNGASSVDKVIKRKPGRPKKVSTGKK